MTTTNRFPLILWDETEEYKTEYQAACERFKTLYQKLLDRGFRCTFLGDLKYDQNGDVQVWLNSNPSLYRSDWTAQIAQEKALIHGDTGWWSLDELADFVDGHGLMFECAMWDFGWRRNKLDQTKWTKLSAKEKDKTCPAKITAREEKNKHLFLMMIGRIPQWRKLMVLPNSSAGMNRTYNIRVTTKGMIFIYLWYNSFTASSTEQMGILSVMANKRALIAANQNDFVVKAFNAKLDEQDVIYIKFMRNDKCILEFIWPSQISACHINQLFDDLACKVESIKI